MKEGTELVPYSGLSSLDVIWSFLGELSVSDEESELELCMLAEEVQEGRGEDECCDDIAASGASSGISVSLHLTFRR
jgi:hypothetical protein